MTGEVSTARRWWRSWQAIVLAALVIFALFAAVWLTVTAKGVARNLQSSKDILVSAVTSTSDLDSAALVTAVKQARATIAQANARVHDPIWTVATHLPLVGRTPAAVRTTTSVVNDILLSLRPVEQQLIDAQPTKGQPISPALLRALNGAFSHIQPALVASDIRLQSIKLAGVPRSVAEPVKQVRTTLHNLNTQLPDYQSLVQVAPILLGLDRPHTWLLLMQNGAEARTSGGLIGATGLLRASEGHLKLIRIEPNDVLAAKPIPNADSVITNWAMLDIYGSDFYSFLDMNQSPNFAITARLALLAEKRAHGEVPDGVVAMDEHTMSHLMEITGPVTVDKTTVTAATAVRYITRDIYTPFLGSSVETAVRQKDRKLATLVRAVFNRLSSGSIGPLSLAKAFAKSAADGRISLWSAGTTEQRIIGASSLGHTPEQKTRPRVQVAVVNGGGNKLEAYIQAHVTYQQSTCLTDGSGRTAEVSVKLTNSAPTSGLPSYVAGRLDLGIDNPKPQGNTRELIYIHVPRGSRLRAATFDGKPIQPVASGIESERKVFRFVVESKAKSAQVLTMTYFESIREQVEHPQIGVQPMALPMTTTVVPAPLCP